jgi:hypothetical protein
MVGFAIYQYLGLEEITTGLFAGNSSPEHSLILFWERTVVVLQQDLILTKNEEPAAMEWVWMTAAELS